MGNTFKNFCGRVLRIWPLFLAISIANSHTEAPPPPTQLENSYGKLDFFADFLLWYASETTSNTWVSDISTQLINGQTYDILTTPSVTFDWNYGFRVGLGYHFEHDKWDSQTYWSWFRTQGADSTSEGLALTEFFGGYTNADSADAGKIHWSFLFNMIDWELGRSFQLSKYISTRPFIGLKGGWINQSIHSTWHVVLQAEELVDYISSENLTNDFWGIGPNMGINSKWQIGSYHSNSFNLLGNFAIATMWGNWSNTDFYSNPTPTEISINMDDSSLGNFVLRAFMGLGWDASIYKENSHLSAQLGYELQFWQNQLRTPSSRQIRLHGDLILQGVTLNGRFDF